MTNHFRELVQELLEQVEKIEKWIKKNKKNKSDFRSTHEWR